MPQTRVYGCLDSAEADGNIDIIYNLHIRHVTSCLATTTLSDANLGVEHIRFVIYFEEIVFSDDILDGIKL